MARGGADYGVARFFVLRVRGGYAGEFLLDDCGEFGHLFFHLDHFFAHVQDDFDAGEIYAHVAGQSQDYVEAFEIGIGIEARVALRARRLKQTDAFVKAQSLRVQFIKLGYGADHVAGFGPFSGSRWHCCSLLQDGAACCATTTSKRDAMNRAPTFLKALQAGVGGMALHSCFREQIFARIFGRYCFQFFH